MHQSPPGPGHLPLSRLEGEGDRRWVKRMVELLRDRHAMWLEGRLDARLKADTEGYFRAFDESPSYCVELDQNERRFLKNFAAALGYRFACM